MSKKQRLIIVSSRQFGYQTDYFKYAQYLKDRFEVVFFCLDQGEKRIDYDGVKVRYSSGNGTFKKWRYLLFVLNVAIYLLLHSGTVMIAYCRNCALYKRLLPWRKMVINFRTVSVAANKKTRHRENERLRRESLPFDRVIMISEGGVEQLGFDRSKCSVVSLGADVLSETDKDFNSIRLLYVGTFDNRDLQKTIEGLHIFVSRNPGADIHYELVGDGEEYYILKKQIRELGLQTFVTMHGRKPYDELPPFFDRCNVGISFVPITEWYAYQPPTKTFEYVLSGLFCIATDTYANHQVINSQNGLLIQDTPGAFAEALNHVYNHRSDYNSSQIRKTMTAYTWDRIIDDQLIPALE